MRSVITLLMILLAPVYAAGPEKIPLIHTTDLFHPPADPDDHLDLATLFALDEFDIRAVLLDRAVMQSTTAGEPYREPGFVPVVQLCYLTGRSAPVAAGPGALLKSPADAAADRPRREQAAIELLLRVLRESPEPVVVTVLGSARIVTAAFNRDPELLRRKVKSIVVNAGSSGDDASEYNVMIDVAAYVGLFRSGLPIDWYPCAAPGPNRSVALNTVDRNSYWKAAHADLFRGLPQPLLGWFVHGFAANGRGDLLRALREQGRGSAGAMLMQGERHMWSTASMALAAGRVLAKTPEGWRFVPAAKVPAGAETQLLALDPVSVTVTDDGRTKWQSAPGGSHIRLFRRHAGPEHTAAITEALNALLRSMPVEPL
jgi:hypothetical protein